MSRFDHSLAWSWTELRKQHTHGRIVQSVEDKYIPHRWVQNTRVGRDCRLLWHTNFSKRSGSRYFWPYANTIFPLFGLTDPVIPKSIFEKNDSKIIRRKPNQKNLRFRPLNRQFVPQSFCQHPTQSWEKIASVQQIGSCLVNVPRFSVVVPRGHTPESFDFLEFNYFNERLFLPQRRIIFQQFVGSQEILVEVWSHVQVVCKRWKGL